MTKNDWLWVAGALGVIGAGYYLYTNPQVLATKSGRKAGEGGSGSCIRLLKDRPWGNPSNDISVLTSTGTIASGASISAWLQMMRCDYILFDETGCTTCGITNCNTIQPNDNPYVELRLVPESVGNQWPLLQSSHPPAPGDPQAPLYHWSRIAWGSAYGHGWSGEYYWWGNFPTYAQDGRPTAGGGWHLYWAFASLNAQGLPVPLDQTCDPDVWMDTGGWYCLSVARNLTITDGQPPIPITPPSLTVVSPTDGMVTYEDYIVVSGYFSPDTAWVRVNGHEPWNDSSAFYLTINIPLGESTIIVTAGNAAGITTVTRTVWRVPPEGGLMVVPFKNQNYAILRIDGQIVDIWSITSPNYGMLATGAHTYSVDWGVGGAEYPFTITEGSCLVLGGGAVLPWTQRIGCYPYTKKCAGGKIYICQSNGTWRVTTTTC